MAELHVLRVFTTQAGDHGNALGVFLQGEEVPDYRRQDVARDLGFSETVFVERTERAELRIFTPGLELPFAGHPSVGTAWLLRESGVEVPVLHSPAGAIHVHSEGETTWIGARPEWSPPFEYLEHGTPGEVDSLRVSDAKDGWVYAWAWEDEEAGRVRARAFVTDAGIPEDEATGSAALALCARLGRPIDVRQGLGSEIAARPAGSGFTEIGGRVVLDEVREYVWGPLRSGG